MSAAEQGRAAEALPDSGVYMGPDWFGWYDWKSGHAFSAAICRQCDGHGNLLYEGEHLFGKFYGQGKQYRPDGTLLYEGEFRDDKYWAGRLYRPDGSLEYEGGFRDGKYNWTGKLYRPDGSLKYEGEFRDGKYNGAGRLYRRNGSLWYEGEFENSWPRPFRKRVTLYYSSGKVRYCGTMRGGKASGQGRWYCPDGKLRYEGGWQDNKPHGLGRMYCREDGSLEYEGEFQGGRFHGRGREFWRNGVLKREGLFEDGEWKE